MEENITHYFQIKQTKVNAYKSVLNYLIPSIPSIACASSINTCLFFAFVPPDTIPGKTKDKRTNRLVLQQKKCKNSINISTQEMSPLTQFLTIVCIQSTKVRTNSGKGY